MTKSAFLLVLTLAGACIAPAAQAAPSAPDAASEARIFPAVLPMAPADADRLLRRLRARGLARKWEKDSGQLLRNTQYGNSQPLMLPGRHGNLCLATALRSDVDKVMRHAPKQDAATRQAVTAFLIAHEESHCRNFIDRMRWQGEQWADTDGGELPDELLWQEEALADQRAGLAMRRYGASGHHAVLAWERRRLFDLLSGDLTHWSPPLLAAMGEAGDAEAARRASAAIGGEGIYASIDQNWHRLHRSLFAGPDGSAAQLAAWEQARDALPPAARAALPELAELRRLAQAGWPDAADWRLPASGRSRPPKVAPEAR